jgi:hypothetical protein
MEDRKITGALRRILRRWIVSSLRLGEWRDGAARIKPIGRQGFPLPWLDADIQRGRQGGHGGISVDDEAGFCEPFVVLL